MPNNTSAARSIDSVLADSAIMAHNQNVQADIDMIVAQLTSVLGLTGGDIIELPLLYQEEFGASTGFTPNPVTARVWGDNMLVPMPFGPTISGSDAMADALNDILATSDHQLGSSGNGMTVFLTDSWDYHILLGGIRAATFADGSAPASVTWWEAL